MSASSRTCGSSTPEEALWIVKHMTQQLGLSACDTNAMIFNNKQCIIAMLQAYKGLLRS